MQQKICLCFTILHMDMNTVIIKNKGYRVIFIEIYDN